MIERMNCEVFQVRTGTGRLTVKRGLAISAMNGKRFIDPQIEPSYNTSFGAADPNHLKLQLSKNTPPELVSYNLLNYFSINAAALEDLENIKKYRAKSPVERPVGRVALVSMIDHDGSNALMHIIMNRGLRCIDFYRVNRGHEYDFYDPFVDLALLKEGETATVSQTLGEYFAEKHDYRLTYIPGTYEGLVINHPGATSPPPPNNGEETGVREPRRPLPSNGSVDVEQELPVR